MFARPQDSHAHSLKTLNQFYEYDDFMLSIRHLADLGCGHGLDLEWWATRTTRDEVPEPLNIRCTGIDIFKQTTVPVRPNINYQTINFEDVSGIIKPKKSHFDVLWCHDSFQYVIDPLHTLSGWRSLVGLNGMLVLILPSTTNIDTRHLSITQHSGCYYQYSLVTLIHMLSVAGWDCHDGFFLQPYDESWLYAVVYSSSQPSSDPRTTTWYDLVDKKLLPDSVEQSVRRHGYVRQQDLVLPWLDKSFTWYGKQ